MARAHLEEAYRSREPAPDFVRCVEADALFHRRMAEVGGNRPRVVILTAWRDPIVERSLRDRSAGLRSGLSWTLGGMRTSPLQESSRVNSSRRKITDR